MTDDEIKQLQDQVRTLTKQLDEKSPEAIYSITVDGTGRAMVTVRSRPGEQGESYLNRFMTMLEKLEKLGFTVRKQLEVVNELPKRDPTLSEPPQPPAPQPQPTNGNGSGHSENVLPIAKAAIIAGRDGLPQLELYAQGHKWADIRYSLGKDEVTRKMNISKMIGTNPNDIKVGWESAVTWQAYWKPGNDPKYKDLLSIAK